MIVRAKAKVLLFICDLSSACLHINVCAMSPHFAIRQTQHSNGPKNSKVKQFIFISSQSHPWIFFNYMLCFLFYAFMSCPIYFLATSFPLFVFSLINKNEWLKKKKKIDAYAQIILDQLIYHWCWSFCSYCVSIISQNV